MKKAFAFAAAVAFAAASCSTKEDTAADNQHGFSALPDITASTENGPDTKTVLEVGENGVGTIYWNPSDGINVFYGNESTHYVSKNSEKALTADFTSSDEVSAEALSSPVRVGLYPYNSAAAFDGTTLTTSLPAEQKGVQGTFDDKLFIAVAYAGGNEPDNLQFRNVCGGIKFTLSRADVTKVTLKGNDGENLAGKVKVEFDGAGEPVSSITEDGASKEIVLTPKDGDTFEQGKPYYIVMLPQTLSKGITVTFELENANPIVYDRSEAVTIKRSVFGVKEKIDPGFAEHEYVDLGLPSGLLWATCNIGASKPEEAGDFFAWGETKSKDTYAWSNYKYCQGTERTLTKYNDYEGIGKVDGKEVLESMDDAATVNWGPDWRMPTKDEFQELLDNCELTRYGHEGGHCVLKSKINGNELYFPYMRAKYDKEQAEPGVYYWSSTLHFNWAGFACYLDISWNEENGIQDLGQRRDRRTGMSVRPVRVRK